MDNIHCDTVTGLIGLQSDEIYLGGVTIDTLGNVAPIIPFDVGSFSNGQDRTVHNPFASFEIDNLNNWPKAYSVTFVLAEKHSGGIYDFIYKLADQAKTAIVGYLTTAVTTATGALIGGVIGAPFAGIGALIGAAVGAVVGWLVGTIWNWMKENLFGDDIFTPATNNLTVSVPGDTSARRIIAPKDLGFRGI